MKKLFFAFGLAVLAAVPVCGRAATVTFTENAAAGYVDIKYQVSAGAEFLNWELTATPQTGSILDPTKAQKSFNTSAGNVPLDTFVNTVFSAVGAGAASYTHSEYNPGSAFPPVPADANPTKGGNPSQLRWTAFDTSIGDGNIDGFFPYHMARVMYTPGGSGNISAWFFDSATVAGGGETFAYAYGVPEPATMAMAGMGLIGIVAASRRRQG
jgi:hypothetical protein